MRKVLVFVLIFGALLGTDLDELGAQLDEALAAELPRGAGLDERSTRQENLSTTEIQYLLVSFGYVLKVDGIYGPQTIKAVRHFQRANGLKPDGIVGPITAEALTEGAQATQGADRMSPPAPTPASLEGSGSEVAALALYSQGATASEVSFAVPICMRESHCRLDAVANRPKTHDYSWGPWQINYYGSLGPARTAQLGPPETNTASWERSAANFLKMLRETGRCPWQPPNYCS